MSGLGLLVLCIGLGMALRRSGRLPETTPAVLNGFITNIALPAMIIRSLPEIVLHWQMVVAVAVQWLMFGAGLVFFVAVGRGYGWQRETVGGLALSAGLANSSFVGLPMIETFYGPAYLPIGIAVGQLGSALVLSTLGIMVAVAFAGEGRR
jgi:predicted permease